MIFIGTLFLCVRAMKSAHCLFGRGRTGKIALSTLNRNTLTEIETFVQQVMNVIHTVIR